MISAGQVQIWLTQHPLEPLHIDSATLVMLRILDRKCMMKPEEMRVLTETRISRPVIKSFKAKIRREGLFGGPSHPDRDVSLIQPRV